MINLPTFTDILIALPLGLAGLWCLGYALWALTADPWKEWRR